MRTPKPHRQLPTLDARNAVRIRTRVQLSPSATRRWAEELRRSPMTVIRKCRNHATPKVFTNASKGKKGAACSASRSTAKNPTPKSQLQTMSGFRVSRTKRKRRATTRTSKASALAASQTLRGSLTCDEPCSFVAAPDNVAHFRPGGLRANLISLRAGSGRLSPGYDRHKLRRHTRSRLHLHQPVPLLLPQ